MAGYIEVIVDAETGERTERPFTAEEIAAVHAEWDMLAVARRQDMALSFAQLMIGLVAERFISEADGEQWLLGVLPSQIAGLISTLPQEQQFPAKARALRPSIILRGDPLVDLLAFANGKSAEEIDDFFVKYASA